MSGEVPVQADGGVATTVAERPTGTLTMLFSDFEGSTVLVRRLGSRTARRCRAHRTLLRAAFRSFGGPELSADAATYDCAPGH